MADPKLLAEVLRRRKAARAEAPSWAQPFIDQADLAEQSQDAMANDPTFDWYVDTMGQNWEDQSQRSAQGTEDFLGGKLPLNSALHSVGGALGGMASPVVPLFAGAAKKFPETTSDIVDMGKAFHENVSTPVSQWTASPLAGDFANRMTGGAFDIASYLTGQDNPLRNPQNTYIDPQNVSEITANLVGEGGIALGAIAAKRAAQAAGQGVNKIAKAINDSSANYHGGLGDLDLAPEEAMSRWDQIRSDSGQNKFADDAPTLEEFVQQRGDELVPEPFDMSGFEAKAAAQQTNRHITASELEPVAPKNAPTPEKMKALSTARRAGERRVGKTIWKNPSNFGSPTGYEKTEILHNPSVKQIKALKNKAPYGELRWLADTTTGDIHVWPAAHGFHNDAAKAMGVKFLDDGSQMIHGYFDDSYPVDLDAAATIDDLLNQQWKGQDFMKERERTMAMAGRQAPHAPGSVNPKAPLQRLKDEPTRTPQDPTAQVREEYPGFYSFTEPAAGAAVDPRNAYAKVLADDPRWGPSSFREIEPGRFMKAEDFARLRAEINAGRITPDKRVARHVGPDDQMPEADLGFSPPAAPARNLPPGAPAGQGAADPFDNFMSLASMKRNWEDDPGVFPQFTSDNAITHKLETANDFIRYRDALKGDGKNRNYRGDVLADNDLARARRDRMQERARERAFTGKELPDDFTFFEENPALGRISSNDIERLTKESSDFAGLDAPTAQWLHDEAGWYKSPMTGTHAGDPYFRPTAYDESGSPVTYTQAGINDIPQIRDLATKFTDQKLAAGSIGEGISSLGRGVAKALVEREAPTGARLYERWNNNKPQAERPKKPIVTKKQDGTFEYRERQQRGGDDRVTLEDLDMMDPRVHIDGQPVYKDLVEPKNVKKARSNLATGTSRFDDPTQYGVPTGVPYTNIIHNPTIKQFKDLAKKAPYGEVRYLVDENGDTHIWAAQHAYHDDVAMFMGHEGADDMLHGNMNKNAIKRVMDGYDPDNIQQLVFADNRMSRAPEELKAGDNHPGTYDIDNYMADHGIRNPVWSFEQARFDNQMPYRRAGDGITAAARTVDADSLKPEGMKAASVADDFDAQSDQYMKDQRAEAYRKGFEGERKARERVRKKGEPSYDPKLGYLERQQKSAGKITKEDLDNFDAAASFDGNNKDWSKVPVKDIHELQRDKLLDDSRPIPTEAEAPKLPNMREAKKVLTPEETEKLLSQRTEALGKRNEEAVVKASTLGESISKGLAEHLKMSPAERAVNLKAAEDALAKAMGRSKGGKITRLFTKNAKLLKAEKGYDGNQPKTPVKLPNGQGIETTGMALAPSSEMRGFKTCPNSKSCRDACLGFKAGQYYQGGVDGGPQTASRKRTIALLDYPEAYGIVMHEEIAAARRTAIKNGNVLGVRLNVLSDVDPKVYKSLLEAFPDVWFYDYTKMNYRPIAPNHHVTYSSTGVSNKDVTNLNQNWSRMRSKLDNGDNVAMAFTDKKSIPKFILDEETGKLYRTVDGVGTDFRPGDLMETDGNEGVIVALKNMEQSTHKGVEHMETAGFLVPYDAKYKRVMSKTGKPGKYIRDEAGNMVPTSEIAVIPKQVSRKSLRTEPRVKITVAGKDMSDYGGQSSGYTPDPADAPAAGMARKTNEAASQFERTTKLDKNDPTYMSDDLLDALQLNKLRNSFGYTGKPLKDRTPADWVTGKDPDLPKRPFSADYPGMVEDGSPLKVTRRGTPITAKEVVGRRTAGGDDISSTDAETFSLAKYLLEDSTRRPAGMPKKGITRTLDENIANQGKLFSYEMSRDRPEHGLVVGDSINDEINLNSKLPEEYQNQILGHEAGHGMFHELRMGKRDPQKKGVNRRFKKRKDDMLRAVPPIPDDIAVEMRQVYHDSNSPWPGGYLEDHGPYANLSPENNGYPSNQTNHELFAEFFAVARRDPNYVKTVAPNAYEWMAWQFDNDPELRKVIQFNSPAAAGVAAALLAKQMAEEQGAER